MPKNAKTSDKAKDAEEGDKPADKAAANIDSEAKKAPEVESK
jgi:hypothetical protein